MSAPVHYAVENDFGLYAERNACCGNNFHRRKKLTDDPREVTCAECLKLTGFAGAKDAQEALLDLTVQQLTGETYRVAA